MTAPTRLLLALLLAILAPQAAHAGRPGPAQTEARLPATAEVLPGYDDPRAVASRLRGAALSRVEGLWEFAHDGGLVAVERVAGEVMLVAVQTPVRSIPPGTVLGLLRPTAKTDTYEALLYTGIDARGTSLNSPRAFTLRLGEDDAALSFTRVKKGWRIDWWRLLPYAFRLHISRHDDTPAGLPGLRRVWPPNPNPLTPRYL